MFLKIYLSTDESQKSAVLLSEVLADKAWGHSYAANQTAFNKYSGYPEPMFIYFEKVNTFHILFRHGLIGLRILPKELSVVQDLDLA